MKPFRIFVTGTDTGVGKTQVSAALLSLLADDGQQPVPFKPYESGCPRLTEPQDALALAKAARTELPLERISLHRYRLPLAPGVAAQRERRPSSWARTLRALRGFDGRSLVMEGAGGLFVPLDPRHEVIDLIAAARLPVLLVARAGLGTLNHTALSLLALQGRGIRVRAVLLSRSSPQPDPSLADNARLIAARHGVRVLGPVPFLRDPARRRAAFRHHLRPLLAAARGI